MMIGVVCLIIVALQGFLLSFFWGANTWRRREDEGQTEEHL